VIPSFEVGFQSIHLWKGKKITKTSNATLKNQQEDVEFTSFAHTFSIDSLSLGVLRLGASSGLLHHRRNFQRLDSNGRVRETSEAELIIHNLHPNFSSQVPATFQCNIAHPAFITDEKDGVARAKGGEEGVYYRGQAPMAMG
jgi:hypothetical protein